MTDYNRDNPRHNRILEGPRTNMSYKRKRTIQRKSKKQGHVDRQWGQGKLSTKQARKATKRIKKQHKVKKGSII